MGELGLIGGFLPLIIVLVLMYVMMIRPQQKQQKQLSEMRSALKVGDNIVTIGGIKGKISKITDDTVTIETGNGSKIDFIKTAIANVYGKDGETAVEDEK